MWGTVGITGDANTRRWPGGWGQPSPLRRQVAGFLRQRQTRSHDPQAWSSHKGSLGRLFVRKASPPRWILSRTAASSGSSTGSLVVLPFSSEVQDLDEAGGLAGRVPGSHRVDVELVACDVLGLHSLRGLEIDDRDLAGIQSRPASDGSEW